jgi:hypothetical protein
MDGPLGGHETSKNAQCCRESRDDANAAHPLDERYPSVAELEGF